MLSLAGATKRFGDKAAVDSVNLNLLPGERLCLLGHNGAGKTTLMRMVVGMARPTEGSVLLMGKDPLKEPAVRRHLGYLSDSPYIYDKLTSEEHLSLHASLYELPPKEVVRRGAALLEDLKMGSTLDQRAETFSFGMQKKLALALAVVHEPSLLVLDEPLNGLDPGSADKMEDLLVRYAAEDKAILLSTHSVEFAARFATRIGVMTGGSLALPSVPRGGADPQWIRGLLGGEARAERSEEQNGGRV